jgi:hypothetical protein
MERGMRYGSSARLLAVLAGSTLGASAWAQDSVSTTAGLPGDAVSAYTIGANTEQVNNYVVDLTDKTSSWGNLYRFGPLMKGSAQTSSFFTTLIGAQAASNQFTSGPFLRAAYSQWNTLGAGVNATRNSAPANLIDTSAGVAQQFAVAFAEFGGGPNNTFGDGDDDNNIITGVVSFQFRTPSRLYVSRIVAASNRANFSAGNTATATLGLGGIDEAGNVHFAADGFGMVSGSAVADKRYLRVNSAARNTTLVNQVSSAGASDSTNSRVLLSGNQTSTTVPTILSSTIAGRPVLLGGDFAGNYIFENVANSTATSTAYLPSGGSPRGPISLTAHPFARVNAGASVATAAVLSRASADTRTRGISVWGVKNDGSVDLNTRLVLPSSVGGITDPTDGYDPAVVWATPANHEFTNFAGQVSFRGGSGPVAVQVLPSGDLLVAATVATTGTAPSAVPQSMDNYLAVARVNATSGAVTWSVAAHTGNAAGAAGNTSKVILGVTTPGGPLVPIGRIARYSEVFSGATNGPSISSPAIDAVGNLYFLATVSLNSGGLTTGLIKANYNGSGAYELELLARVGDVIAGANSTLNYQIQFMGVADADSVDSGAIFSGNIVQDAFSRVKLANTSYGSPLPLGALVVRAKIVYDRNNDGQYRDPTVAGNAGQPDQAYNVAMIVMPGFDARDYNSDGFINLDDLGDFITDFYLVPPPVSTDYNEDGFFNLDDLGDYITDFYLP